MCLVYSAFQSQRKLATASTPNFLDHLRDPQPNARSSSLGGSKLNDSTYVRWGLKYVSNANCGLFGSAGFCSKPSDLRAQASSSAYSKPHPNKEGAGKSPQIQGPDSEACNYISTKTCLM